MTRPAYTYTEMVGDMDNPPTASGFSIDGGAAEMTFLVTKGDGSSLLQSDLNDIPFDVLGKVTTAPTTSGARAGCRSITTPLCHPYHPWLYAVAISDMRGRGKFLQSTGGPSDLFDCNGDPLPCFPSWCFFNNYIIKVAFKALPWNVIDDSCVTAHASSYYLDNDNGTVAATGFNFAPLEWCRYIDVQVQTKEESHRTARPNEVQRLRQRFRASMAANGAVLRRNAEAVHTQRRVHRHLEVRSAEVYQLLEQLHYRRRCYEIRRDKHLSSEANLEGTDQPERRNHWQLDISGRVAHVLERLLEDKHASGSGNHQLQVCGFIRRWRHRVCRKLSSL